MAMATQIFRSPLSPPLSPSPSSKRLRRKLVVPAAAVPISNAQTRERQKMKDMFREARERCVSDPMDGVDFTVEEFHRALDDRDFGTGVGCKVKGTIFMTSADDAIVDISAKSSAFLPIREACIYEIKHVSEAGIYPGLQEEFVVIGENTTDDSLILSLRLVQSDLAWERCQQLQAEDVVVKDYWGKQRRCVSYRGGPSWVCTLFRVIKEISCGRTPSQGVASEVCEN